MELGWSWDGGELISTSISVERGFGGTNEDDDYNRIRLKSIEVYNAQAQKWELSNIELSEAKADFGFMTIKSQPWIQIQLSPKIILFFSILLWNPFKIQFIPLYFVHYVFDYG